MNIQTQKQNVEHWKPSPLLHPTVRCASDLVTESYFRIRISAFRILVSESASFSFRNLVSESYFPNPLLSSGSFHIRGFSFRIRA